MNKGIVYYTDSQLDDKYAVPVRKQLLKMNLPIVSASLKPLDFGTNITICQKRGYMTMFNQIFTALRLSDADIVFFAEHDVLYHPSHFDFLPERKDTFYYNQNVWKVRASDGHALHYLCSQTSGLCAYRDLLVDYYQNVINYLTRERCSNALVRRVGFEPGTHNRVKELKGKSETWMSDCPNIDIRHDDNLTKSRWNKEQFRNQKYTKGWIEDEYIPCWGRFSDAINMI